MTTHANSAPRQNGDSLHPNTSTVDQILSISWDRKLAKDLAAEIEACTGERRDTVEEMRRFLALKGYRELLQRLRSAREGNKDAVRQPILTHELPDVFLGIEFGRARRQRQERDIAWNPEVFCTMPSGLIEDENGVSTGGDFGCDFVEVKLHGLGVAGRQHEGCASSAFGADRTEQIGRLGALIMIGSRT